ncbi:unnamed protein product [Urochloa humidicola]
MEAPLHQLPVPLPPPPEQDTAALGAALLRQAAAARAIMMTAAAQNHQQQPTPAAAMRREQCPRCASRDTKFCYYNNYNTAQPRHFCRACRRYWTLGGSLRNVPVGGSTRNKRPRPARPTRAIAAAVAAASGSGGGPFAAATSSSAFGVAAAPAPSSSAAGLLGSLLLGSPLLSLGAAPLLEGRLGSGSLVLGQQAAMLASGGGAGDLVAQLGFGAGVVPMPWPATAAAATVLEGDRVETEAWKPAGGAFPFPLQPAAAALWQELAAAALPAVEAGAGMLHHGGSAAPNLLM